MISHLLQYLCQGDEPSHGIVYDALDSALAACRSRGGRVLVIEAGPASGDASSGRALNLTPEGYRAPEEILAAGGYVVRRAAAGVEVLLIHRRGVWDLPKGKLDPGESPEAGALREVSEEVGVPEASLALLHPLGTTIHGYPHPKRPTFAVKTTHWFALATSADSFVPQATEDIERVEWVRWEAAGSLLGFQSLRNHHASVDPASLGV